MDRDILRSRARLVGRAVAVGVAVGVVALVAGIIWTGDVTGTSSTVFALGSMAFGVGLLGWSGSVLAGGSVETMQRHLDTGTDWTEADSRRAMARIGGFGAGWMVGASLAAALLGA